MMSEDGSAEAAAAHGAGRHSFRPAFTSLAYATPGLALAHMLSLPVELWCAIFARLALEDRISVTHVCRKWRTIALNAPAALWAQIAWDDDSHAPSILGVRLERAGSVLIDLSIRLTLAPVFDVVCQLIQQRMPQLRTLKLDAGDASFYTTSLVNLLTSTAAPHLESFSLDAWLDMDEPLFANAAPKLNHVSLYDASLMFSGASYPSVRWVSTSADEIVLPNRIFGLLDIFPSCEVLMLDADRFRTGRRSLQECPPSLYGLILKCSSWRSLRAKTLATFPHSDIQSIDYILEIDSEEPSHHLTYERHGFPVSQEIELLGSLHPPNLHLSFSTYEENRITMVRLGLEDEYGLSRTFAAPYASLSLTLPPEFFTCLTSLDVNERDFANWFLSIISRHQLGVWATRGGVFRRISLPHLQRLTLFLLDQDDYEDGNDDASPFLLPEARAETTDLMQLKEVHLTAFDPMTLAPEMVSDLLVHLGCPTPLDLIAFHNVRVLETRIDAVADMLTRAKAFDFTATPLLHMSDMAAEMPDIDADIDFS